MYGVSQLLISGLKATGDCLRSEVLKVSKIVEYVIDAKALHPHTRYLGHLQGLPNLSLSAPGAKL